MLKLNKKQKIVQKKKIYKLDIQNYQNVQGSKIPKKQDKRVKLTQLNGQPMVIMHFAQLV